MALQRKRFSFVNSIYWKLALASVVLISLISAGQLLFSIFSIQRLVGQIDQQLYWDLAPEIANAIQPFLKEGYEEEELEKELLRWATLNPTVDFYILDKNGTIIHKLKPEEHVWLKRVSLEPIKEALSLEVPAMPIYGEDPGLREVEKAVFSVAPLRIGEESGYLYLILTSRWLRHLTRRTGQFFIVESILGGTLLIAVFGLGVGIIVYRYLSRQFSGLIGVVREYQNDNFENRIPLGSKDEIGELADSINTMADTIVVRTDALKATDRMRRELLTNIVHDLRTPLTAAKGFLETVKQQEKTLSSKEQSEYLEHAYQNVLRQERFVNDLFELSQLDAREEALRVEAFSLDELVEDILAGFNIAAEKKGISLGSEIPERLPFVYGDIAMIERVISNLLSNALRYTEENGKINLEISQEGNCVRTSISDTGVGIPEEELPKIFESFYRVHKDRSRKTGGTGLGLSIVKKILELHDSEILVNSIEGEGTTFSFSLRCDSA